jgi:hypothetical protein
MSRRFALVVGVLLFAGAPRPSVAEELAVEPVAWEAADVAAHQYFYLDFARQLQSLDDAIVLAEYNVVYWQHRVAGYQPFRRFGRYAATYSVDQLAQMQLIAAQQELACLVRAKGDLWRARQLSAAGF